jgi:RNA polymerase sigma-70 factor, ECF subfamily
MAPLDPAEAAALVRRCQRELPYDTRSFAEIVHAYQGRVYTIAYRMLGDRHEAEDVAQEVFLKVFRSLKSLNEPQTLTAWIDRIATNTCLDILNSHRRRPQTIPFVKRDPEAEEEPAYADLKSLSPDEQAIRAEERRCLERALATLEPQMRSSLILRDVEGWSYQDIASKLALGLSAVKMRIHRARLSFQQLLERICPDLARRDPNTV